MENPSRWFLILPFSTPLRSRLSNKQFIVFLLFITKLTDQIITFPSYVGEPCDLRHRQPGLCQDKDLNVRGRPA